MSGGYSFSARLEEGYVHATVTGPVTPETEQRMDEDTVRACLDLQCDRVLIDTTGTVGTMSDSQIYASGASAPNRLAGAVRRMAWLGRPGCERYNRFYETVVTNRGLELKLFSDRRAAVDWLTG